jgi:osmotically-inducible protein OsmY
MRRQNKKLVLGCTFVVLIIGTLTVVAANRPNDDDIKFWIKDAISEDPYIVDSSAIEIKVLNGIVTLSGDVKDLSSKKYADLEAKKIRSVLGVINMLTVSPENVPDTDIVQNIKHRIADDAAIKSQNFIVTCHEGNVILTGDVASWSEKKEAGLVASEVRAVRNVQNDLNVNSMFTRSDEAIKADVQDALRRDVYMIDLPINVVVSHGFVTLRGTVGSEYEKTRAYEDVVWVENIKNIKHDLVVEWWEKEGARTKPVYNITDAELVKAVTNELQQDSRLDLQNPEITASYGLVILQGSVPDYYQKRIAQKDASDVVGVGWVTNNLVVNSAIRDDSEIRSDILFDLSTDNVLWNQDINVKVNEGIVTLSGKVSSINDKAHALTVASRVRGVKEVKDQIEVDWKQEYKDEELLGQVINRIKSNWLLSPLKDKIKIFVHNGTVTLTGTVNNWSQRHEAEQVALDTKGVKAVDNRIQVEGYNYKWEDWYSKGSGSTPSL